MKNENEIQVSKLTSGLRYKLTHSHRVASESSHTRAEGGVVDDLTLSIDSTHADTRVHAAIVDTSTGLGTICVENTLGPTPGVRVS